jgi:hypothetical protein
MGLRQRAFPILQELANVSRCLSQGAHLLSQRRHLLSKSSHLRFGGLLGPLQHLDGDIASYELPQDKVTVTGSQPHMRLGMGKGAIGGQGQEVEAVAGLGRLLLGNGHRWRRTLYGEKALGEGGAGQPKVLEPQLRLPEPFLQEGYELIGSKLPKVIGVAGRIDTLLRGGEDQQAITS